MRRLLILVPVMFATVAVGFILYRTTNSAEALSVSSGAETNYWHAAAGKSYEGNNASQTPAVPDDILYSQSVKSVVFSHQTHAVELELKCDSCHTSLFKMEAGNAESQPDFNMQGLADGKYCGSCHSSDGHGAFAADTQCARCHQGVKGWERAAEADGIQSSQEG